MEGSSSYTTPNSGESASAPPVSMSSSLITNVVTSTNSSLSYNKASIIGKVVTLQNGSNVTYEDVLAEGGFGIVFLVKGSVLVQHPLVTAKTKHFAMKRVIVNNDTEIANVKREVVIMTTLGQSHPHILPCLDYLITSNPQTKVSEVLCLMPLCKTNLLATLNSRMSTKSHLSPSEIVTILSHVNSALARLHQCATPIIHRDVKIENILEIEMSGAQNSSSQKLYVLCDFGSATARLWDPSVHNPTLIQEDLDKHTTLAYRSPEMVDLYSSRGPLDRKSDIWALGVMAYKMCFYTTPFGDSVLAIQSANVSFPSNSPQPKYIHALINYLLTENAALRPDAWQVSQVLKEIAKIVQAEQLAAAHAAGDSSATFHPDPLQHLPDVPNISDEKPPPGIDTLVKLMDQRQDLSLKAVNAPVVRKSPVPTKQGDVVKETSVTPRQRPKAGILPTPGTPSNLPGGLTLLNTPSNSGNSSTPRSSEFVLPAPPKSPKLEHRMARVALQSATSSSPATIGGSSSGIVPPAPSPRTPTNTSQHQHGTIPNQGGVGADAMTSSTNSDNWNPFGIEEESQAAFPIDNSRSRDNVATGLESPSTFPAYIPAKEGTSSASGEFSQAPPPKNLVQKSRQFDKDPFADRPSDPNSECDSDLEEDDPFAKVPGFERFQTAQANKARRKLTSEDYDIPHPPTAHQHPQAQAVVYDTNHAAEEGVGAAVGDVSDFNPFGDAPFSNPFMDASGVGFGAPATSAPVPQQVHHPNLQHTSGSKHNNNNTTSTSSTNPCQSNTKRSGVSNPSFDP